MASNYQSRQKNRELFEIENGLDNLGFHRNIQHINGYGPTENITESSSQKSSQIGIKKLKTVVIVGTGDLGRALTVCLVRAGYRVVVASRTPEKHRLRIKAIGGEVVDYSRALYQSSIILIAIPYEGFGSLPQKDLNGRIVVDVSNRPLDYDSKSESLAVRLQTILPESRVVKAFNTLSAYALQNGNTQGSKEIPICSDDEEAKVEVITLARNLGFSPVDFGSLSNAKAVEDIPLAFFPEWKFPGILALTLFLFSFLLQLFRQQLCPNFQLVHNNMNWTWDVFEMMPLTTVHKSFATTALTLLTSCYFPGVVASYLQLYRQTKYSNFPNWLDVWLKGRKNIGLLTLGFAFSHYLMADLTLLGVGGFDITYWRSSLYLFCGATALLMMIILGITSLPSVSQNLTWREFSFIHRYLGWLCLFFATCHIVFMKWDSLYKNNFVCIFIPDSAQIFIWFPLITILLKLPLLLPWVDRMVQNIRRGYEGKKAQQKL